MLIILLSAIINPSVPYGRINIEDRINDYIKSFNHWNILVGNIPYKVFIFENSGYEYSFNLNDKITYISEHVELNIDGQGKGRSLAASIKRFIDIMKLQEDDKLLVMTARYAPLDPPYKLFELIEENELVISGLTPKFGKMNTEWFAGSIKILRYIMNYCILYSVDKIINFENTFYNAMQKLKITPKKYYEPIYVIPTFYGGINKYTDYI